MNLPVRIAAALVLSLSLGLHWALLQTVAWTGMLVTYAREGSFAKAVSKTFDGQHPCKLCLAIKKGRAAEKKKEQQQTKPGSKLDAGLIWQPVTFHFGCGRENPAWPQTRAPARVEPPPKPRPRNSAPDTPA